MECCVFDVVRRECEKDQRPLYTATTHLSKSDETYCVSGTLEDGEETLLWY